MRADGLRGVHAERLLSGQDRTGAGAHGLEQRDALEAGDEPVALEGVHASGLAGDELEAVAGLQD